MQLNLETESRNKLEAMRVKKKLEQDINDLEMTLDGVNKAKAETERNFKKYQQQIRDLQQVKFLLCTEVYPLSQSLVIRSLRYYWSRTRKHIRIPGDQVCRSSLLSDRNVRWPRRLPSYIKTIIKDGTDRRMDERTDAWPLRYAYYYHNKQAQYNFNFNFTVAAY